jgi:hypothetical protein
VCAAQVLEPDVENNEDVARICAVHSCADNADSSAAPTATSRTTATGWQARWRRPAAPGKAELKLKIKSLEAEAAQLIKSYARRQSSVQVSTV